MKINGELKHFYHYAFPMQAVLVTCHDDKEHKTNVITIAWHTPLSKKPPLYGISVAPQRHSHHLITHQKEFVINFLPYAYTKHIQFCGSRSGKQVDKISEIELDIESSESVQTPRIKQGYAHLECTLHDTKTVGDHTFFVGKIVHISIDDHAFKDSILSNKTIHPVFYLGDSWYSTLSDEKETF